jgi:hypothetical protein
VISSVSGGGLPAAYYCVSRDPGPYSVVRVETLPHPLPPELESSVKLDRRRGLLGCRGQMTPDQRDLLRGLFVSNHDRAAVDRLFWLSHHTHAPAVWQAKEVRDLMTHDYIQHLLWISFSPLYFYNNWLYWLTSYDRSDQMAEIFRRYLYGTKLIQVPKPLRDAAELEFLGWLDRPQASTSSQKLAAGSPPGEDVLCWPDRESIQAPIRLDWIPGYSQTRQGAQFVADDVIWKSVDRVTRRMRTIIPFRFKDLNPERPYLILNATNGSEDDPGEPHFGELFTFTREEFKK